MRLLAILLAVVTAVALSVSAMAQDSGLQRLSTGDDNRGWEAVGRLEIHGTGFCTGTLIAPDLVLTAAHCLYNKETGARIDPSTIEFQAGLRNGRAETYRRVRRAVAHPDFVSQPVISTGMVRHDVALLELQQPIRNSRIKPFGTEARPIKGDQIGVVSYAHDRAGAPSLQDRCRIMGRQAGVLVTTCDVDFGSSGAPIFSFEGPEPVVVSVVSAKADLEGQKVGLGTSLTVPLRELKAALAAGGGVFQDAAPSIRRIGTSSKTDTGAKFVKP